MIGLSVQVGLLLIHGQRDVDQLLLEQLIQPFAQVGFVDRVPAQVTDSEEIQASWITAPVPSASS